MNVLPLGFDELVDVDCWWLANWLTERLGDVDFYRPPNMFPL